MDTSQDVEIIEHKVVIEISDDEYLPEEDGNDILVITNVEEASAVNECIEIPDEDEIIHGNIGVDVNNANNSPSIQEQSHTYQTNEIKQEYNGTNVNKQHSSTELNTKCKNNTDSKATNRRNKKKRNRKRKRIMKRAQNNNQGNEIPSEPSIGNQLNSSKNTATISSTEKTLSSHDFSKLKWLRPLTNLSSPPHLQMVIIDRGHPFWRITNDNWLMIEKRLLEALNKEMLQSNNVSIGLFDGAKWQKGIKIVGCHNESAFDFIMKFIFNLDKLWHGAQLDAFPISNIRRHVVKVYIPPPTLKTDVIISLIKLQNPSLCSKDWKVIREHERPGSDGVDIWISVNDESFTQLARLGGEVKYGINRIWLNPSQ